MYMVYGVLRCYHGVLRCYRGVLRCYRGVPRWRRPTAIAMNITPLTLKPCKGVLFLTQGAAL